jgi:ABC-type transporter Mla subunit MlaD
VGLFVLFLSFLGYLESRQKGEIYHSLFTGVENLHKGAAVKYNGVQVGKVTDVSIPAPGQPKVRIDYLVEKPELVTPNTSAQLTYTSYISGTQGISLTPRESQCPRAKGRKVTNHRIPTCQSDVKLAFETVLDNVQRLNSLLERNGPSIDELLTNTNKVLSDVRTLLSGNPRAGNVPEGSLISVAARLDKLVVDIRKTSRKLDTTVDEVRSAVDRGDKAFGSIQSLSDGTKTLLKDNEAQISKAIKDFSGACASLRKTSRSLDTLMQENRNALNSTLRNVLHSTQNLQKLIQKLRAKPSLLVNSPTPPKRKLDK